MQINSGKYLKWGILLNSMILKDHKGIANLQQLQRKAKFIRKLLQHISHSFSNKHRIENKTRKRIEAYCFTGFSKVSLVSLFSLLNVENR